MNISKRGDAWQYRFELASVDGKRKQYSKSGFRTKKEAQIAGAKALAEYESRGTIARTSTSSYADFLDYWLENVARNTVRANTYENYKRAIKNHVKPFLGKYRISALTMKEAQSFVNSKIGEGMAISTLNALLRVINLTLESALELGYIRQVPIRVSKLRMPKAQRNDKLEVTLEDYERILASFEGDIINQALLVLALHTGLRIGELLGLAWKDIDFERCTLHVQRAMKRNGAKRYIGDCKSDTSRRAILLGNTAISTLKAYRAYQDINREFYREYYKECYIAPCRGYGGELAYDIVCTEKHMNLERLDLVFCRENGEYLSTGYADSLTRKIQKAFPYFHFHALRHLHATLLIEGNAPIKAVMERLGHSSAKITLDTYVSTTQPMRDKSVDIIESCTHFVHIEKDTTGNDKDTPNNTKKS